MKTKSFYLSLLLLGLNFIVSAQNSNIDNLINSSNWSTLFPNRAGTQSGHPQGYTTDFYSYANFKTAIAEMADYTISFRKKAGIAGQITTVTRKASGNSYQVSSVNPSWFAHPGAESTIQVDFADFINRSSDYNNKRELAAFLANVVKETTGGWQDVGTNGPGDHSKWGLYFVKEVAQGNCYAANSTSYPAVPGQCYSGRGPIQLSWNYNYGQVSEFLYNDKSVLLNDPAAVERDGVLAFKTAIWFWMTPQCPKPSCHQVMHEIWEPTQGEYSANKMYTKGFAHTNNIINGGLECRSNSGSGFTSKVVLRSELYKYFLAQMGFTTAQVAQENSNGYSTTCYESFSSAMQDYVNCDVTGVSVSCTAPSLGVDQVLCSNPIQLNAGVTLAQGETIAWYKNNQLISGANAATYTATEAGTYKAEITSTGCTRSDEVTITQSGNLQVSTNNSGSFCTTSGPTDVTISVAGGAGLYNFYDVATGGTPLVSASSYTVDGSDISFGQSKTYYVEEPTGETATIGLTARPAADADFLAHQFQNISSSFSYNAFRTVFTATSDVKLESIDFEAASLGNGSPASLVIEVYQIGGLTLVNSKTIDLENISFTQWDQKLYTFDLGFDLVAGQYELSITPSNCAIFLAQYNSASSRTFDYDNWNKAGVASLDGALDPFNRSWGVFKNVNMGSYNWKFSKGGGSGSACGRVPVTVNHDCTTSSEKLSANSFSIFPNPANDVINVEFNNGSTSVGAIELFNSFGQVVLTENLNGSDNIVQIQTTGLNTGIYFVKVSIAGNTYNSRVVVSK